MNVDHYDYMVLVTQSSIAFAANSVVLGVVGLLLAWGPAAAGSIIMWHTIQAQ